MGEIILILFVYLLLFGAKGIPSLAQSLGKAVYHFRNAAKDVQSEIMKSANDIRKEADIKLDQIDLDAPSTPRSVRPTPPTPEIESSPAADPS